MMVPSDSTSLRAGAGVGAGPRSAAGTHAPGSDSAGSAADEWLLVVRSLLRIAKRLTADGNKAAGLPPDARKLAAEAAQVLDMCLSGLHGRARLHVYYECIRERNALEGFRQLLLKQFSADSSRMTSRMDAASMPAPVFDAMLATLPPRLRLCVSNLNAILRHLAEHLSRAAMALSSAGQYMMHEEDVIKVVAEAAPWRQVEPSDRLADSFPYYGEAPGDCGTFGSLARGVVDDLRFGLQLAQPPRPPQTGSTGGGGSGRSGTAAALKR